MDKTKVNKGGLSFNKENSGAGIIELVLFQNLEYIRGVGHQPPLMTGSSIRREPRVVQRYPQINKQIPKDNIGLTPGTYQTSPLMLVQAKYLYLLSIPNHLDLSNY